jgi:hypothetical protein
MARRKVNERTAASTIDALLYALRRGIEALNEGHNMQRLGELSDEQMFEVCVLLQKRKPPIGSAWTAEEIEALSAIRNELRHE